MNKLFFRLLVILMSLSLIGIILVQGYWFDTSFKNNDEQFKFHAKQVLGNVANKLDKLEAHNFYEVYNRLKDSIGKTPQKSDFLELRFYQRDVRTNETIVYSNSIISEDYGINSGFYDKNIEPYKIIDEVKKRSRNGSIVVFHDSMKAENNVLKALPVVLKFWKENGYEVCSI